MTTTVASAQPLGRDTQAAAVVVEEASLALVEMTLSAVATARGLSTLQLRMLLVVDRHAPLNLSALAERLDQSIPSASRLVERLVVGGLVKRGPAEHSRREVALSLTPRGRRALMRLRGSRQKAIERVLARMPLAEQQALVTGLAAFAAAND